MLTEQKKASLHAKSRHLLAMAEEQWDRIVPGADSEEIESASIDAGTLLNRSYELQMSAEGKKPWAARFVMSAKSTGLSADELSEIIASSDSAAQAKTMLIEMMVARDAGKPARNGHVATGVHGEQTFNNPQFLMEVGPQAIAALISGKAPDHPAAKQLASANSLKPILAAVAEMNGIRGFSPYLSTGQMLQKITMAGAHSTSDFQHLVAAAFNLRLKPAYEAAPCPIIDTLAFERDVDNLNNVNTVAFGEQALLDKVPEGGEINYGSTVDGKETYVMATYAKMFAVTRNLLINDQLSALDRIVSDMGRAAKQTAANAAVALLTANSGDGVDLSDGSPIYSTARGNKAGSGAAISISTLSAAREALRTMKGLNGVEPIAVAPRYLLVGAAKETEAEQILHELSAVQVSEVNPFAGALALLVEPRLIGNSWRLFPDAGTLPMFEVAYLAGNRAPIVEVRQGWNVLGTEWRVIMDLGIGAIDWRTYLNPGN